MPNSIKHFNPACIIRLFTALHQKLSGFSGNETSKAFVILLLIVALAFLIYPRPRLYHLDAETEVVQLIFSESTYNKWLLEGFLLCQPKDEITWFEDNNIEPNEGECLENDFKKAETFISEPILKPHKGAKASIEWSIDKGLVIELKAPATSNHFIQLHSANSDKVISMGKKLLLYRPKDATHTLTLPFEAVSVFGTDVRPGVRGILKIGNLTVYENSFLWQERYLAGENPLFLGDTVKFISSEKGEDGDLAVKGFMRIESDEGGMKKGIQVVAYSGTNDINYNQIKVKVFRFGSNGYIFSPSLWTRIENAPDVIFIISLFGLLMAVIKIASLFNRQSTKKQE